MQYNLEVQFEGSPDHLQGRGQTTTVVATRAEIFKRLNLKVGLCCLGSLRPPHTHEINPCSFKRSNSSDRVIVESSRRFLC